MLKTKFYENNEYITVFYRENLRLKDGACINMSYLYLMHDAVKIVVS